MKTRKELREEFNQMKYRMGVFQIRNLTNGKIFIGSSLDLKAIWFAQRIQLNSNMHESADLQKDWKQSGPDNFIYEILEEIEQHDDPAIDYNKEVKALEYLMIEELQPFDDRGYNRRKTLKR